MSRGVFISVWCALALFKLALAVALPLFGDEAFYAWEGRHLAWSYSDVPPLTAWLTALGRALLPGEFGVRLVFIAIGLWLPWQIVGMTRRWYGDAAAWRAGILALLLPLASALGVMALPDVPMAAITLLAVAALEAALRTGRLRDWLLLGAALGLGMLSHYRFAMLPLAVAFLIVLHPAGRAALHTRGPWLAAAVALVATVPLVVFNLDNDLAALRFQLVDRHPWTWQWGGALQILEQAAVTGPLMLGALVWTVWDAFRRRPLPWPECVAVPIAALVWLLFFVLGFFADSERFRWHWPLPAYLFLLPALAARWPSIGRRMATAIIATTGLVAALALSYLTVAAMPERAADWLAGKRYPANFSGWREAAAWVDDAGLEPGERLVAGNFMLAAALDFYRPTAPTQPMLVLDDALNRRHGRSAQLAIWGIDETALMVDHSSRGLVVAEETAQRFSDRWAWYQSICARFDGLELDDPLDLHGGRKRFVRWRYRTYDPQPSCRDTAAIPPLGWVEIPSHVDRGDALDVFGWAMQPELGIDVVEILVDDVVVAQTRRTIDIQWVEQRWGDVGDPAGLKLAFRVPLETAEMAAGAHRVAVRVRRGDGRTWPIHEQPVVVSD
jgi:hypothetical protein